MRALIYRRSVLFAVSAALLGSVAFADEQVRSVQEALKEQQFFFGEVTGERDEETRAAVRRFQIHSGLPVTGEIDATTVAALQDRAAPEAAATPETTTQEAEPAAERSVRGRMRSLVRSDEEFLKEVESTEEPAPPVPQIAPPPVTPEEPAPRDIPPPPPARPEPAGAAPMSDVEAERFVRSYLNAAEAPTPDGEVAHYADRVDYFDSGRVNRRFIEKDQKNYYRRWPERDFDLQRAELLKSNGDSATVRFRTKYALRGNKDRASGEIENVVRLTRDDNGDWRIASIRERKLGN